MFSIITLKSGNFKSILGYARISNTEFYHMGQYGYTKPNDPRYALVFVDTGPVNSIRPSYIKNNAFHNGFSPAVGLFDALNMPIEDNVFHSCYSHCKYKRG